MNFRISTITSQLGKRILVLDGAMGTMIQRFGIKGANNESLSITHPEVISEIHRLYLEAGADIISTNTFSAQRISQAEYKCEDRVREYNYISAQLARAEADKMSQITPDRPRFVAGSIGPTSKTASMSQDVDNPAQRDVDFDEFKNAYKEQIAALIDGGVDVLLMETIFDTLNTKAALEAAREVFETLGKKIPVMLSVTIADAAGRMLSGQTIEAFILSVKHYINDIVISIGLNCSFGARDMQPFLEKIKETVPCYVSAHPNAGFPDVDGNYSESPELMAEAVKEFLEKGLVNIIGGCCGSSPEHISKINQLVQNYAPVLPTDKNNDQWLAGLDTFTPEPGKFMNVGERCNVAGSKKFLRLISEKNYDEALSIARKQVRDGAHIIDVNMDDGMLDAEAEMVTFLRLMASDPEIARLPWMIDSSRFNVIESALKNCQGKCIVNSLSLKEGEAIFLEKAEKIRKSGAALVVMAFDENGQATTYDSKISICKRAYDLLTTKLNFPPEDIIFDPNILTIGTGIAEHALYGIDFIRATEWIHNNLPHAKVSGGVSNLSFAFRGNNYLRETIHSVFLHHAQMVGMDMGIVNPSTKINYEDIPSELRHAIEDLIFNRSEDAVEQLLTVAQSVESKKEDKKQDNTPKVELSVEEKIAEALRLGESAGLEQMLAEAKEKYPSVAAIVEGPLMDGMQKVGDLFAAGKMFLPQVVKTARTMKEAVNILMPPQEQGSTQNNDLPKYLFATVKGDVHDIGKNIAGVVLSCNGFNVIDLGVMVPAETIVETAIKKNVDFIGLSGLITPSLEEMRITAAALKKAGVNKPIFIGGATTSAIHTAAKIAPEYDGPVFWVHDAAQNPVIASQLMSSERNHTIACLKFEQEQLRQQLEKKQVTETNNETLIEHRKKIDFNRTTPCAPSYLGERVIDNINICDIIPYINWIYFYHLWGVKQGTPEAEDVYNDALQVLETIKDRHTMRAIVSFHEANGTESGINAVGSNGVVCINTPRQQKLNDKCEAISLCDFVAPSPQNDHIGVFAITISESFIKEIEELKANNDQYKALLLQSIADRLAEASSEFVHEKVRKELWGYAKDEDLSIKEMFKAHYKGIRPAIGYPSLPSQKEMFNLAKLIDFSKIGITLTENGAMYPQASVSGIYIANEESEYFYI
ncbi:MAG: methionine synthase [Paludibacteraceae bacterium]|nr:methionine synthase [Paludibacteraceae bacterium]